MEREEKEVADKIAILVELLRDGFAQEYKDARGIQLFHTPEGPCIAVAVFTIEGFESGNNYTQYMAVLATLGEELKDGQPLPLSLLDVAAIGGKGWRGIDSKHVRINREGQDIAIALDTKEYGPDDPMCCPSKKSKTVYLIRAHPRGRLKELEQ